MCVCLGKAGGPFWPPEPLPKGPFWPNAAHDPAVVPPYFCVVSFHGLSRQREIQSHVGQTAAAKTENHVEVNLLGPGQRKNHVRPTAKEDCYIQLYRDSGWLKKRANAPRDHILYVGMIKAWPAWPTITIICPPGCAFSKWLFFVDSLGYTAAAGFLLSSHENTKKKNLGKDAQRAETIGFRETDWAAADCSRDTIRRRVS